MIEYLPREVVLDILSRLPVTSLLHSKLVCKAWHNLVQDPLLVCMQFSRTIDHDPCLIFHCDYPIQNQLFSLELSALSKDVQRVNKIRVPVLPEFEVLGSCKGLLCLCDSSAKDIVYVYNPFTRDYIELEKSTELLHQNPVLGFGFNQTTSQYKVVKAVYQKLPFRRCGLHHYYGGLISLQAEVQILTLGSPAWRNLEKLPYHLHQGPSQVSVCGRLHWRSWPRQFRSGCLIISFDLEDEQFREVPKPDCDGLDRPNFHLLDLGGCLSAAIYDTYGQFEIWIMKEYNVKESWIKEFNIGNHVPRSLEEMDWNSAAQPFRDSKLYRKSSFVRILCVLKNGDILLLYKGRALMKYLKPFKLFESLKGNSGMLLGLTVIDNYVSLAMSNRYRLYAHEYCCCIRDENIVPTLVQVFRSCISGFTLVGIVAGKNPVGPPVNILIDDICKTGKLEGLLKYTYWEDNIRSRYAYLCPEYMDHFKEYCDSIYARDYPQHRVTQLDVIDIFSSVRMLQLSSSPAMFDEITKRTQEGCCRKAD
ncbi:hypothetical protein EZV62_020732 [Acer yangbiense]|uniref:F-box domain-containing protein n=1 Tax=Acer yangbiense TaxID=1000413 RepID=A0A5C7HGX6_9ROSI|nr:hypothetical protein EZV62_020732 [Acer yangbiense]